MKTENKKVWVYAKDVAGVLSVEVTSIEFFATHCCDITRTVCVPIFELEIEIPSISSEEAKAALSGALLESLVEEREKLKAQFSKNLSNLDARINELKAIEYKGDENE